MHWNLGFAWWQVKCFPLAFTEAQEGKQTSRCIQVCSWWGPEFISTVSFFFQHVVLRAGGCAKHIAAYSAMADLLDLIQVIPLQIVSCDQLEDSVASFLQACLACNLLSSMTTKFHWLLHLPFHVKKFEAKGLGRMLPSCFVQERKHKVAKRYAENICNTSRFETSILQEIICHDLAQLKGSNSFQCKARLEKESPVPRKLADFFETTIWKKSCKFCNMQQCISWSCR